MGQKHIHHEYSDFIEYSSSSVGGAIYMEMNNVGHKKVGGPTQSTLFISCFANCDADQGGRDGGICLRIEIENAFVLENLGFTDCHADIAGNNLYFYSTRLYGIVNNNSIKFTMTASASDWMSSPDR